MSSIDYETANILITNFYEVGDSPLAVIPSKELALKDIRYLVVKNISLQSNTGAQILNSSSEGSSQNPKEKRFIKHTFEVDTEVGANRKKRGDRKLVK